MAYINFQTKILNLLQKLKLLEIITYRTKRVWFATPLTVPKSPSQSSINSKMSNNL